MQLYIHVPTCILFIISSFCREAVVPYNCVNFYHRVVHHASILPHSCILFHHYTCMHIHCATINFCHTVTYVYIDPPSILPYSYIYVYIVPPSWLLYMYDIILPFFHTGVRGSGTTTQETSRRCQSHGGHVCHPLPHPARPRGSETAGLERESFQ